VLLLLGIFVGLVVADARAHLLIHACHCAPPFRSTRLGRSAAPVFSTECGWIMRPVITG
jgi:hypothetical protein